MKHSCIAVLACLATFVAAPSVAAPVQWSVASGGNGHWYELVEAPASFEAARALALLRSHEALKGYLATVTSAAEQAFLITSVNTRGVRSWLGGSDAGTEGEWKWLDGPDAGQVFGYVNWSDGEPNNIPNDFLGFGEDALEMLTNGRWNDAVNGVGYDDNEEPITVSLPYIVEYGPVAPIPLPAALPLLSIALGALGLAARRRKAA